MRTPYSTIDRKKKDFINILIPIAVLVLCALLPGIGVITDYGILVIGTFIALLYAWVNQLDPWLAIAILMGYALFSGNGFTSTVFTAMMSNMNVWLVAFALWYVAAIKSTGLVEYLSRKMLSIKLAKKGPYYLMFVFMAGAYVITAITMAQVPLLIFLFSILGGIAKELELEKNSSWTVSVAVGMVVSTSMGMVAMPFSVSAAIVRGLLASAGINTDINLLSNLLVNVLTWCMTTAVLISVTKFIIRPKVDKSAFQNLDLKCADSPKFTKKMGWAVATMLVIVLVMALPYFLPQTWQLSKILTNIGSIGAFALGCILLCLVPDGEGGSVFNFTKKLRDATEWGSIWYLACVFYVGGLMSDGSTGISAFLQMVCSPLNTLSPFTAVLVLNVLCCLTTNFITNSVCAMIFGVIGSAIIGNGNPALTAIMVVGITCASNVAMAMPSSSVPGMIIHTQKDMFKSSQIILWGFSFSLICTICLCIVTFLLQGILL